ncbi:MAG: hypothetical protein LC689_11695 [Myxococcales bacterium]|nr:hypothetical protein [Myxococcales bacterium]
MKQPLLALLAARALTAAAALWAGVNPLRPHSYVRWDSNLYLSIAQRGYFLEHCGPGSHYDPSQWCGNAGWFPLYGWLLKVAPGAVLSLIFQAILLALIWRTSKSWPVLLLAAFFPGCIYQQAVFPVSLFLVCALVFLQFWRPEAGALAAMAYPTGFLLVPVAILKRRWWAALGVVLGFLAVLAVMQLQTLLPVRARIPLLVAAVPIAFAMSVAFFRGSLV